jgi:hypothetical protein
VLFYSTFVALKDQDASNLETPHPLDRRTLTSSGRRAIVGDGDEEFRVDAQDDYVYLPNEEIYGGQIIFPPNKRHALRIYRDRSSGGARMEARPLRGPKTHVPIWTAFVPPAPSTGSRPVAGSLGGNSPSVKLISKTEVEVRRIPVYTFLDGFELPPPRRVGVLSGGGGKPATGSGAFVLQFADEEDAETFTRLVKALIAGGGRR